MRNRTEYKGALDEDERLVIDLIGACRKGRHTSGPRPSVSGSTWKTMYRFDARNP